MTPYPLLAALAALLAAPPAALAAPAGARRAPGAGPAPLRLFTSDPILAQSPPPLLAPRAEVKTLERLPEPLSAWPAAAAPEPPAGDPVPAVEDPARAPLEIVALGKLPGKISRQDLEETGALVLEVLAALDRPAATLALIADGVAAESKSSLGRVTVPLRPASERGDPIHPRRLLAILAHELTHPVARESLRRRVPEAVALRENPPFVQRIKELRSSIGQEGVDGRATMAELRVLAAELKRALLKIVIFKGYDEILADLVAVAVTGDPRAIHKAVGSTKDDGLYRIASLYRRFDRRMTPARVEAWKRDTALYDKKLGKQGIPDPYLLFAPARAWLWELLRGPIAARNFAALSRRLAVLVEVMAEETRLRFASVDAGRPQDPVELNRTLIGKFKARSRP